MRTTGDVKQKKKKAKTGDVKEHTRCQIQSLVDALLQNQKQCANIQSLITTAYHTKAKTVCK
jgi:hypothetical protein